MASEPPALNIVTGIPAATAFLITAPREPVLGSVTAIPSTFLSMAAWTSWACLAASGSLEYWRSTLSLAAPASAPLRTMSQNVSPGAWWVIIAMVIFGVLASAALAPPVSFVAVLPPAEEHAARENAVAMDAATTAERGMRIMTWVPFECHR